MIIDTQYEEAIKSGTLEISGRLVDASNATLYGEISYGQTIFPVVYKPIAGERPLWDFENGNLASREVAAYQLSQAAGFELVPPTLLRDGPFGVGAVQRWIDLDEDIDLITWAQSDDPRLRNMALFDAVINNTDRKFGHILLDKEGNLFGCDHGVTFHEEAKLRTVLWQFAEMAFNQEEIERLENLAELIRSGNLNLSLLITEAEIAALILRIENLRKDGRFPLPNPEWPAVPWPPV